MPREDYPVCKARTRVSKPLKKELEDIHQCGMTPVLTKVADKYNMPVLKIANAWVKIAHNHA